MWHPGALIRAGLAAPMSAAAERPGRWAAAEIAVRLVSSLLGLPLIATILISLIQGTRHLSWDWPVHAHHHLLAHIASAVGLSVVSLLLIFGPLQRGEPWVWWALAIAGLAIYGGFWLGNAAVGLGEPGAAPNTSQAVQTVLYMLGLALGWREVNGRAAA